MEIPEDQFNSEVARRFLAMAEQACDLSAQDPSRSLAHCRELLEKWLDDETVAQVKPEEHRALHAEILRIQGSCYHFQGESRSALHLLLEAQDLVLQSANWWTELRVFNTLAVIYKALDDFSLALRAYNRSLTVARRHNRQNAVANLLGNIGVLYADLGDLVEAEEAFLSCVDHFEKLGDEGACLFWYANLGELYLRTSKLQKAEDLLNKALELSRKVLDRSVEMTVTTNLGELAAKRDSSDRAIRWFMEADAIARKMGDKRAVCSLQLRISELEAEQARGFADSMASAVERAKSAFEQATTHGFPRVRAKGHLVLARLLRAAGRHEEACTHYDHHIREHTRLQDDATRRHLHHQKLIFETSRTRQELQETRQTNDRLRAEVERRTRIEEDLKRALEQASNAVRTKTNFLALISHEVRTPLNGIIGLMEDVDHSESVEERHRILSLIRESSESLLGFLDDVLESSRLDMTEVSVQMRSINLVRLTREVSEISKVVARRKGLILTFEYDPGTPQFVIGDPARIRQVMNNLVSNAIKYTDEGGVSIRLSGRRSKSGAMECVLEVADTGIGISEEWLPRVFDQFMRVDEPDDAPRSGTGLGLAIVQRLVSLMEGRVEVESQPGKGSTFRIFLKADEKKLEPVGNLTGSQQATTGTNSLDTPTTTASASGDGAGQKRFDGLRALVVDDLELNVRVIRKILDRVGVQIEYASSGKEALERLAISNYDLVLTDIRMPGMDGIELTRAIRSKFTEAESGKPFVIAMSAHSSIELEESGSADVFDAYLAKPIRIELVEKMLSRAVAHFEATRKSSDPV